MGKVMSLITDTLMHSGNYFTSLFSYGVSFRSFFYCVPFALCFGKRLFFFAKESLVGYCLPVTGYSKGIETHVNACWRALLVTRLWLANITRDRCKPFTRRCASDSARLCNAAERSMLDNANTAYFAQSQALAVQSATAGKIRIGNRIIAILSLISGKASFLASLWT